MNSKNEIEHLKKAAETVLAMSVDQGASQAEVSLESNEGFSVGIRCNALETLEFHQGKSVSVVVYLGQKSASASTTDLSETSLNTMVKAAIDMAHFMEEDPYAGLADASLMAKNYPNINCFAPWDIEPKEAIQQAIAAEQKALNYDKRITNSDGVSVTTSQEHMIYANTHGFCGDISGTSHSMSCALIAQEKDDMQQNAEYTYSYSPEKLKSFDEVALATAKKTINQLHSRKLTTQKIPIIFDAMIAASLISAFFAGISGGNLYRESSFLLNKLGQPIFPEWMNIMENPHQKEILGASPFDAEGVLTRQKHFIQNGILESYLLSSYSARRLNLQTTANAGGAFNVSLASSEKNTLFSDQQALLKHMDKGVLVTSLMGSSINIITGDYSRGARGFWVENGEIQYPVQEFTIAGNLSEMFMNIQAFSQDIDTRKNIKSGSILLSDMMIAGV